MSQRYDHSVLIWNPIYRNLGVNSFSVSAFIAPICEPANENTTWNDTENIVRHDIVTAIDLLSKLLPYSLK